jgi:UDP-N-acetyl-D-mannosaminuronate dehydrogenase
LKFNRARRYSILDNCDKEKTMKKEKIRVVHYGLGPIGIETARYVLKKSDMEIVGAVDISKDMIW